MVADYWKELIFLRVAVVLLAFLNGSPHPSQATDGPIQPGDLKYLGAFRLPGSTGGSNWTYIALTSSGFCSATFNAILALRVGAGSL